MIWAILPFAILGATIPNEVTDEKPASEQKSEANGFSTGTQPADIEISKGKGDKQGLSQGLYARYSKLDKIVAEVKIVGSTESNTNQKDNSDSEVVYGCRETDFKGDYEGKIAVLFRGACKFEKKIHNAAMKNATGVVVINNNPEGVITMSIGDSSKYEKVAIMIPYTDGLAILENLEDADGKLTMTISKGEHSAGFEKIVVIVICLAFLILLTISLAWVIFYYVQRFRILHEEYTAQKKQEQLMIKALEKLRIETLKSNSELVKNHTEICCAVCIENFETGTQVRYLTCGHPYHKKCIDPWLMEKGSCPQCKVDVLKQLGLRDSTNFATGPEETTNDATLAPPHRDLNLARQMSINPAYVEDTDGEHANSELEDSGVEDELEDERNSPSAIARNVQSNNNSNIYPGVWMGPPGRHSQLDRARSEPIPPIYNSFNLERNIGQARLIPTDGKQPTHKDINQS